MKRKIDIILDAWQKTEPPLRKPLLIRGVRQCGKTYAIEKMLKKSFNGCHAVLNLEEDEELVRLFEGVGKLDQLLVDLSAYIQRDLEKTSRFCLFIDDGRSTVRSKKIF